jgi:hypothetical protein
MQRIFSVAQTSLDWNRIYEWLAAVDDLRQAQECATQDSTGILASDLPGLPSTTGRDQPSCR